MTTQTLIFAFRDPMEAARAGMDMNKADPSFRYVHAMSTLVVTWYSSLAIAAAAVREGTVFTIMDTNGSIVEV